MTLKEKQDTLQKSIDQLNMMQNDPTMQHQDIEKLKREIEKEKQVLTECLLI